jgi:hypothetical protein
LAGEIDADAGLRATIKAAVDEGRLDLAARLLDVLRGAPPVAAVVDIRARR